MVRVLLAALIAAFFMSSAVAQECQSPAAVAVSAMSRVPEATVKEVLHGDAADAIIAAYNEMEPQSTFIAESVAVIQAPRFPVYLLIAYLGSCVVFADEMPREMYDAIRKSGV